MDLSHLYCKNTCKAHMSVSLLLQAHAQSALQHAIILQQQGVNYLSRHRYIKFLYPNKLCSSKQISVCKFGEIYAFTSVLSCLF